MLQDTQTETIDAERSAYVTPTAAQHEVSITGGALKKYLAFLGIEPVCFSIGAQPLHFA